MQILNVAQMRAWEQAADAAGHTYAQMMELAGQGVARALLKRHTLKGRRALVLVGPGNNGGDGLVTARYLTEAGGNVTAYLSRARDPQTDAVYQRALERKVAVVLATDDSEQSELRQLVTHTHFLIDALLGTGATPPLTGTIADILRTARKTLAERPHLLTTLNAPAIRPPRPIIVAVDGPSGLDFDTGALDPLALPAHLTVTFAAPKWGHFRFPGGGHCGELVVAEIGIPASVTPPAAGPTVATPQQVAAWLPTRAADAHKGTFGRALIVAGSANYTGAAALAAQAAVRSGAGLVTLALASSLHSAIAPLVPEATYLLLPHALGALTANAHPLLADRYATYDALLVGPGLGQAPETEQFIQALLGAPLTKRNAGFLAQAPAASAPPSLPPLVIDADGLNLLAKLPEWPTRLPAESILTPHPGELARLTELSTAEIQADRLGYAQRCATEWGQTLVLKGAFTIVAAPDGRTSVLPFANAALATAGTGDVLAGAIVALRAQGLPPFEAAVAGAYLHGLAGELARQRHGVAGVAAGDVALALGEAGLSLHPTFGGH